MFATARRRIHARERQQAGRGVRRAFREQFRILFLDKKNRLVADEVQQVGTVDHTPVYPREVIKRALELSASAIILVHNHPSGDPSPSSGWAVAMPVPIATAAAPTAVRIPIPLQFMV